MGSGSQPLGAPREISMQNWGPLMGIPTLLPRRGLTGHAPCPGPGWAMWPSLGGELGSLSPEALSLAGRQTCGQ